MTLTGQQHQDLAATLTTLQGRLLQVASFLETAAPPGSPPFEAARAAYYSLLQLRVALHQHSGRPYLQRPPQTRPLRSMSQLPALLEQVQSRLQQVVETLETTGIPRAALREARGAMQALARLQELVGVTSPAEAKR